MPPSAHREDSQTRGANGVPPPPPGPPPRSESLTRIQQLMQRQRTVSGPLSTRQGFVGSRQSPPVPEVPEILTLPSSSPPPAVPPKRKMEQQEDSGRQRASPRHEEERERQRREDNNPWKEAIDSPRRAATLPNQQSFSASPRAITPARESFTEPEPSPTFTVYRDSNPALNGSAVRRKPVGPQLVTQDLGRGPQLPTPPPQQSSPISPGLNNRESNATLKANGEGPSRKDTGKEPEGPEDFIHQTRRRYKEMLQAEDAAYTDADKLRIFLHFVERECKIRQPLYSQADPTDLKRVVKILQVIAMEEHESLTPISPVGRQRADRDGDIDMSSPPDQKTRPGTQWWGQNLTAASFPTSAMSAYEQRVAEEESSRGRASSRWWENSNDDGGSCSVSELVRSDDNDSVYGSAYPRRSKRFTKKPRQSLKEIAELANSPRSLTSGPGISHDAASYLNSTVYPPDRKAGSRSRSRAPGSSRTRVPRRRDNLKTSLDIAPLLTLLPVWPREYPAINNCHPRLDVFRDLVRTLNDLTMLKDLQQRFAEKTGKTKDSFVTESQRRRISQAERIQRLYSRGDLHYDEMERLNLDFEREETKINHEAEEEDFKAFDVEVVTPAHRDLHERINAATAAYSDLIALIKARNPNLAADSEEQPELLEYLTALKWIFDVRETLHQSVFEMLTERNERYKSLTLGPLRTARDQSRFQSTSAFFTQDAATRLAEFNKQKILRHEQFMDFTENQVTLGVEEARSRFWEVAPLVMECLEKIPDNLENVVPIIPPEESSEHPEWVQQPMRYLERKIAETEGAMRGLGVEEGEGLLCLLHGVKSALTRARAEAVHGDDGRREERRLTEDLKEKVGMIEDEWREGLGGILERIKEDVEREMDRIEPGRKGS
ncbi:hypothetical protein BZA05DRAFT_417889 [Tricharina praecox]|uniref:uncharacterized protein n=1 Tax=Tricharina praecox TaxID=43433 RepID=UPI00221E5B1B|nr:uncharacterized protein BZA05DRAFT_417889 [Tricharina praecox]KAI5853794.1 hypothetical protein BZA05DRAFT_417889 [Tricharina praecox]